MIRLIARAVKISLLSLVALQAQAKNPPQPSLFSLSFENIDGSPYPLSAFEGKVLVLINTATECGFAGQLAEMETLHQQTKDKGVIVLSIPSNDFSNQEPRDGKEIVEYCERKFRTTFPIVNKTHVRHYEKAHPVFRWIADNYGKDELPTWNYGKYVFDRNGALVDSFSSITSPTSPRFTRTIEEALAVPVALQPEKTKNSN